MLQVALACYAKEVRYTFLHSDVILLADVYIVWYCSTKVSLKVADSMLYCLQGDMDEVVPFAHGQALHAAAKNPYPPLWACGYGHQNLEFCKQYLPSLHEYLRKLFGREYGML